MKRLIFVFLLMTCSVSWAEWEIVTSDSESDIYADRETIRKKGNFVEMWRMKSFVEVQVNSDGKKFRSVKFLSRFDCKDETVGSFSFVQYSEEYGRGDVVSSGTIKKMK